VYFGKILPYRRYMLSKWCRIGYNNQNGTRLGEGEVIWAERLKRAASRPSPAAVGFLRRLAACGGVLAARDDAAETAAGQELLRHDLVRRAAGRWTLTAPGLSYLRRIDEGRRLRRMAAALGGDI